MDHLSRVRQEDLLSLLVWDEKSAKIISGSVPDTLFEGEYGRYAREIYRYIQQYGTNPAENVASIFADDLEIDGTSSENVRDFLQLVYDSKGQTNRDFVLDGLQTFLRQQYLKEGIIKAAGLIQNASPESLAEAENLLSDAFKQRLNLFDPGTFLSDTERSFRFLDDDVAALPTGIPTLDSFGLGPIVGGLHLFIGLPKRGKTWWLINLGKRALMAGHKVCHITLEMPEYQIAGRYYQALFALAKRDTDIKRTKMVLDSSGHLEGFDEEFIKRPFAFNDPDVFRKLSAKVNKFSHKLDNIVVKQFPSGKLSVKELEAYLASLEEREGFRPDLTIVDYADLMNINSPKFYRQELGRIYVDLRGVASERQTAVATASQSSRQGMGDDGVSEATVAEDFSKIATADCVIAFDQTREEKAEGLARLKVTNARSDADNQTILITQNYATGQFATQSWLMPPFTQGYKEKLLDYLRGDV